MKNNIDSKLMNFIKANSLKLFYADPYDISDIKQELFSEFGNMDTSVDVVTIQVSEEYLKSLINILQLKYKDIFTSKVTGETYVNLVDYITDLDLFINLALEQEDD